MGVAHRPFFRGSPTVLLQALLVFLLLGACGNPKPGETVGTIADPGAPVPSGPHLYCIANVSHTLVAYSLTETRVLPETARYLDLDPVGPWFVGGQGFYISRVEGSGAGSNALIRFDPKSKVETGRLKFPPLSNPNDFFPVPGFANLAWVALRGSTFDGFNINGLSVVNLSTMKDTAFCDLNADTATCTALAPEGGLTSLLGFFHDPTGCPGLGAGGCVYGIVNNFDGSVRDGRLIVWDIDGQGRPVYLDAIPLGRNPFHPPLLDADGELWVVNNGGYVHYDPIGQAGTLQVLDPALFDTGPFGDGTVTTLTLESNATCSDLPRPDPGCDLTGLYSVDGVTGWLTTYPDNVLRTVDLAANAVNAWDTGLARATGPFFATVNPAPVLYAASGGLGIARLGPYDEGTGQFIPAATPPVLEAGLGPLTCAEFDVP